MSRSISSDLPGRIAAANPDAFVSVVTLRREAYDQIRTQIRDLPGTVFEEGTLPLAPTRTFARALLGTVGDVTREQLDANPGKYLVGEQTGQSGLQKQYDDLLRGTPGVQIVIPQPRRDDGTGDADVIVFRSEPAAGEALKTTLDQKVQNAADAALAATPQRSALVAIRVSDGAILATANGPAGGELNLAFTASVPPGSTFKMVTALGLLDAGQVTAGRDCRLSQDVHCGRSDVHQRRRLRSRRGAVPCRLRPILQHRVRVAGTQARWRRVEQGGRVSSASAPPGTSAPRSSPAPWRRMHPLWRLLPPPSGRARRW